MREIENCWKLMHLTVLQNASPCCIIPLTDSVSAAQLSWLQLRIRVWIYLNTIKVFEVTIWVEVLQLNFTVTNQKAHAGPVKCIFLNYTRCCSRFKQVQRLALQSCCPPDSAQPAPAESAQAAHVPQRLPEWKLSQGETLQKVPVPAQSK